MSKTTTSWIWIGAITCLTMLAGCSGEVMMEKPSLPSGKSEVTSQLSTASKKQRARKLKKAAAKEGLTNAIVLAGIAQGETGFAHCWSEATWACKGPYSSSCNGPVIAGAGDGPCYQKQGGLGMFQFDGGTYNQTLRRDGRQVLTLEGNVRHAVDFVAGIVEDSRYIGGVSTRGEAIDWLNEVEVGGRHYSTWIKTVTAYYNGCFPGRCSIYWSRYSHYDDAHRNIYNSLGESFWNTPAAGTNLDAIEVYWHRKSDGSYKLHALPNSDVQRVEYYVDGYKIGEATRSDGSNFPDNYTFSQSKRRRHFEVRGFDSSGEKIAQGVGMLDVRPDWSAYIKQMGERTYEIGIDRAPSGVAAIEVRADGYQLTDGVSNSQRSSRNAVRSSFNSLGERQFKITTYNADGSVRGNIHRTFTLE